MIFVAFAPTFATTLAANFGSGQKLNEAVNDSLLTLARFVSQCNSLFAAKTQFISLQKTRRLKG